MKKQAFIPENAPVAGPYSPAVKAGELVFFSGQIAMDSETGKVIEGDVAQQADKALQNLDNLLKTAGMTFDNIVKTNIFLTDISDFATVNEVYSKYFKAPYPARSAVAVVALPLGVNVEVEAIAIYE